MDVREKLVELIAQKVCETWSGTCDQWLPRDCGKCYANDCHISEIADYLISNGVTVQEHGYWETVVEVRDNTVCGNGVKIEYKRCSCCKNPAKFFEDDFCGNCGAKLDLPQPTKGE